MEEPGRKFQRTRDSRKVDDVMRSYEILTNICCTGRCEAGQEIFEALILLF